MPTTSLMCGVLAIISLTDQSVSVDEAGARRMLAVMDHRGPDDEQTWSDRRVVLGHRRLAVRCRNENRQPRVVTGADAGNELVLVFNGELYDTDDLRRQLAQAGVKARGSSDTELLALALARWRTEALRRLRGMFAFVAYYPGTGEVLIARDALGVVPIYFGMVDRNGQNELVVASEPTAILAHPSARPEPDWATASNYLITLRTTLGPRTLFRGLSAVEAGCLVQVRAGDAESISQSRWWKPSSHPTLDPDDAVEAVRTTVTSSIEAHLVADDHVCCLLSGGLDSSIVTAIARRAIPQLQTFAAGASISQDDPTSDLAMARVTAAALDTEHHEAWVDERYFQSRWLQLVNDLGVPLTTPNEVGILAVSEAIRPLATVTLSGEGADELFAGYEPALALAEDWIGRGGPGSVAEWHADTFSWVHREALGQVLNPAVARQVDAGEPTLDHLRAAFCEEGDPLDLATHLRMQRRLNLPSLLARLNTATMRASVEGRTPFADRAVAELAARLPLASLLGARVDAGGGGVALATLPRTKRVLRQAFADIVPASVLVRPKASFPLPFERWLAAAVPLVASSTACRLTFSPSTFQLLSSDVSRHWRLAWPILNLGLWLRRWWG